MIPLPGLTERRHATLAFFGCWAAFLIFSFLRVPVPGINEPHYLGMAKADWNPAWCRGDLFLESSKPHRAFYLLVGWMTEFLTLELTAIVGRFASLSLAAWGWSKLCRALDLKPAGAMLATSLLLLIQSAGSWSGEWLIGGVESKVFAYGFVFAGWGALCEANTNATGIWLGLATSLHPVVGMWATLATVCSLGWNWWLGARTAASTKTALPRLPIKLAPSLWWFVTAAPGIGWALPALQGGDAATSKLANFIQVSYRLAHHLDPWTFPGSSHAFLAGLIAVWMLFRLRMSAKPAFRELNGITGAAILFGLAAMALSYGPRPWSLPTTWWQNLQLTLLKFYAFRLADLMSAVIVAVLVASDWVRRVQAPRTTMAMSAALLAIAIVIPGTDKSPGGLQGKRRTDWMATLSWVRQHTPPDALLLAANEDFGVKWWAERLEYVNFKDCPQDAAGVVKWNERLVTVSDWIEESQKDELISRQELAVLKGRTGVTHLLVSRLGPIEGTPVFERGMFRVFELGAVNAEPVAARHPTTSSD